MENESSLAEEVIEQLCDEFEKLKPYLLRRCISKMPPALQSSLLSKIK